VIGTGQWMPIMQNTVGLITALTTYADCSDRKSSDSIGDCGCANDPNYQDIEISLKVVVEIDLTGWCTIMGQDNMAQEICYDYMGDYILQNGADTHTSQYLRDYCDRRYPNDDLSIFNTPCDLPANDCNVCACNMPAENYTQFLDGLNENGVEVNLTSIAPNCAFPACSISSYKPDDLEGCPSVNCLNNIVIEDNNIVDGDLNINQDASCTNIYTTVPVDGDTGSSGGDTGGGSSGGTTTPTSGGGTTPTDGKGTRPTDGKGTTPTGGDSATWAWIIGIIVVLLVIVVVIVIVAIVIKKKKEADAIAMMPTSAASTTIAAY